MKLISTEGHLSSLKAIAEGYEFPLEAIETAPNIKEWCDARGVKEDSPWRVGKCLRNASTGKYRILLAAEITSEMQHSVITTMELSGFGNEVAILKNQKSFLIHLLLHEIAHAQHSEWEEIDCDKWAFGELKRIQSSQAFID